MTSRAWPRGNLDSRCHYFSFRLKLSSRQAESVTTIGAESYQNDPSESFATGSHAGCRRAARASRSRPCPRAGQIEIRHVRPVPLRVQVDALYVIGGGHGAVHRDPDRNGVAVVGELRQGRASLALPHRGAVGERPHVRVQVSACASAVPETRGHRLHRRENRGASLLSFERREPGNDVLDLLCREQRLAAEGAAT